MGSSISKIYDDYDDYEYICKLNDIKTVDIGPSFYDHQSSILNELGFKDKYDYFAYLRKVESRDKKIDEVIQKP